MEQVDFYILAESGRRPAELIACRLAEKAYGQGHRVFILCQDAEQAETLDDLLWTFRQGSFLPHARAGTDPEVPIELGESLPAQGEVLINLGASLPEHWQRYTRLAEVVDKRPEVVQAARERFRGYRAHGLTPHTHELGETA